VQLAQILKCAHDSSVYAGHVLLDARGLGPHILVAEWNYLLKWHMVLTKRLLKQLYQMMHGSPAYFLRNSLVHIYSIQNVLNTILLSFEQLRSGFKADRSRFIYCTFFASLALEVELFTHKITCGIIKMIVVGNQEQPPPNFATFFVYFVFSTTAVLFS
jgi:hypothetical protein